MGKRSLAERKQEALKNLNLVQEHFAQIPQDVYLKHIDIFQPMMQGIVNLRWELSQIDKVSKVRSKKHGNSF